MSTMGGMRKKLAHYPEVIAQRRQAAHKIINSTGPEIIKTVESEQPSDELSDVDQGNPIDSSPETMENIYGNPDYTGDDDFSMNG